MNFKILIIFTGIIYFSNIMAQSSYGEVFNDGLSKMEMIEKIDQYLSKDLPGEISSIKAAVSELELKVNNNKSEMMKMIENLEIKVDKIESSIKLPLNNQQGLSQEDADFLKNLKSIVIPAIQTKLLSNEKLITDFIKQSNAITDSTQQELDVPGAGINIKGDNLNE